VGEQLRKNDPAWMWAALSKRLVPLDGIKVKKEKASVGILSLFPGHHVVSCYVPPLPPHHNELKPLKS
jgi:hypothetical protein